MRPQDATGRAEWICPWTLPSPADSPFFHHTASPVAAAEGSGAGCGAGRDHTTTFPQGPLPQGERDWAPLLIT